jgi:hypothetical protein
MAGHHLVSTPADRDAWQQVAGADSRALVTQTPAWFDCVCAIGGYVDASRLYEGPDGRRIVLPLARRRFAGLTMQASLPSSWGFGGLIADGGPTADDVGPVLDDLASSEAVRTSLRPNPLDADVWAVARRPGVAVVPRLAHVLDLHGGFEFVWGRRFTDGARRAVRKAERAGLAVECDTNGHLLAEYYALFERSLERCAHDNHELVALARLRGRRRDPLRKLEGLMRGLGSACRLWVAFFEGRPAAAILVLQGRNAHYTRGVMDKALAAPTRANYLLHRLAIEEACEAGCGTYHMGESGGSTGLARFKSSFGAEARQYAEYHVERLPITAVDRAARMLAKLAIGFRDAP